MSRPKLPEEWDTDRPASKPPADPARAHPDGHTDTQPEHQAKVAEGRGPDVGEILDARYRLVQRIGGGAMGDVFIAENIAIRMRVAVKLLKPELMEDPTFRERFLKEAQAIASIEHPNVARFLDLSVGKPTFLVMEYVRGQTLAERLKVGGPMPLVDAVQCAVRLCWALGAAHAAGIIHRDLKPSNVILAPDLELGHAPKLIDFGLAKLAAATEGHGLTRTGQVVGTPKYMSPEQIAGKAVDPRSDMYSLGCLIYEMICGRPPFDGEDDVQVLYQQIHDSPQPLRKFAPDVPEPLERAVARVLAKDPTQRYGSVAELARALEVSMLELRSHSGSELYAVAEDGRTVPAMPKHVPLPARRSRLSLVAALVAGVVLGAAAMRLRAPSDAQNGLVFVSEPPGASVVLDGARLAKPTPTWVAGVLPGTHQVRFEREGLAPITQSVAVKPDERAVVQVSLPPATRRLEVRSTPDGASVYVDGRLAFGETPTYVDVTEEDFHELRIVKNGYQTKIQPVTPDDKGPMVVELKPETLPRGTIVVDANSAAEVWIDGLNTGYTTPTLGIQVPLGKHLVELRDGNGGKGATTTVTVGQGQTVRLLLGTEGLQTSK
jgi:tRNA A-37 threonylcarbamoyl transferase component Bud32